jgi:hypothetical protein
MLSKRIPDERFINNITARCISDELKYYDENKGLFHSIFGDSKSIGCLRNFFESLGKEVKGEKEEIMGGEFSRPVSLVNRSIRPVDRRLTDVELFRLWMILIHELPEPEYAIGNPLYKPAIGRNLNEQILNRILNYFPYTELIMLDFLSRKGMAFEDNYSTIRQILKISLLYYSSYSALFSISSHRRIDEVLPLQSALREAKLLNKERVDLTFQSEILLHEKNITSLIKIVTDSKNTAHDVSSFVDYLFENPSICSDGAFRKAIQSFIQRNTLTKQALNIILQNVRMQALALGLSPRLGAASSLFKFFGSKERGPNHPLGDVRPLHRVRDFLRANPNKNSEKCTGRSSAPVTLDNMSSIVRAGNFG